jgi:type IV pilus assembly protein PilA
MFHSVLRSLRERQTAELECVGEAEAGFTLIELMVVLLIIAILLAIAIPTFLGVTSSANDRAAQSNLTNGLTEATAQYQSAGQSFSGVSANLVSSAPEYTWTAAGTGCLTSQANCISVEPVDIATANDQQGVILAAMSKTGTCWWVAQLQATPTSITSGESTGPPANVAFISAASGHIGYQSFTPASGSVGALSTAGTYYAHATVGTKPGTSSVNFAASNCNANYPMAENTASTGFNWGPSFSAAGTAG